ncbi:MAG: GNAT family N-acetyltransferase [Candidatus Dormibacteraeota bacterium]|nr:GNAT family N-acetyltransferase [Candidatus Dormibacteraeota bacterium]
MQVRSASQLDAGEIAEPLCELGYPTDEATTMKRLRRSDELVLVAVDQGRLIGLAALATSRTLTHAAPIGRLTALVVSAAHRRHGVARLLVATVLEQAELRGCEGLELTSGLRPEREAAHAFYEALGFERSSYRYWRPVKSPDRSAASEWHSGST